MKNSQRSLLVGVALCAMASGTIADIVVVGSEHAPLLSPIEARQIYLKKMDHFADGSQVIPVDLADDNEVKWQFYQKVVGKDRSDVYAYWYRANLNRTATQPVQKKSVEELKRYLDATPAAIAYMDEKDVEPGMRVLLRVASN